MGKPVKKRSEFEDELNLRDLIHKYLIQWKWFVLSLVSTFVVAFFVLRYTPKIYESKAKLLIKFEKAGAYSELSAFRDLGMFDGLGGYNNLYNEREILSSRILLEKVVSNLHLNIQYSLIGTTTGIERREFYKNSPIEIDFLNDSLLGDAEISYAIDVVDSKHFKFIDNKKFGDKEFSFGDTLTDNYGKFCFHITKHYKSKSESVSISVSIRPVSAVASTFQSNLEIEPINENVDILELKVSGPVIERNNDFLNELIAEHTRQTVNDQQAVYKSTTQFINDRISSIADELSDVEKDGEKYMTEYDFSDVLLSEKSLYDRTLVNEKKLVDSEIQLELVNFLYEYLNSHPNNNELLPTNLGFEDISINEAAHEFNKAVLDRNRLLSASSEKNPAVTKLTNDLASIRTSLNASLLNFRSSLKMEVRQLRSMDDELNQSISDLPKHKRVLRSIERQQVVKETLYIYLLQKREENEIASAVREGNSRTIETAYSSGSVKNPNEKIHYGLALFFGMLIPFSLIYLRSLLDNKVRSRADLDKYNLPHLSNIPKVKGSDKLVISDENMNSIAEAFRILRTNTSFMLGPKTDDGKIIITTSTIAKEGKSFIALNLGTSFALSGKKTIIVEMDLRSPKIFDYLEIPRGKGITDFVLDSSIDIDKLIIPAPSTKGLSLISCGTKPPNPSEIIMREEIKTMLTYLKKHFDIIVIDTAPVGLVTDTLLVSELSDVLIYVVRANFLEKKLLGIPEQLRDEGKIKNVGVVINYTEENNVGGYGYGYGYGRQEEIKWYKKPFKRNS